MTEHPDPATVARYLAGDLPAAEARAIEAHLSTCVFCRESIRDAVETATAPARQAPVLWRAERFGRSEAAQGKEKSAKDDSEAAVRREAVRFFLGDLGHTLAVRGERAVDQLLELSEHERRRAIRHEPRQRADSNNEDVAARLLARCRAAWSVDLDLAVETAKLAVLVSQRLTPRAGAEERCADLRSLALQHLAASNHIARRAQEIDAEIARRRLVSAPEPATADDAYPTGVPSRSAVSEVAEDALAVEVEAAFDDLRDASLARGRAHDAVLAVLDQARFSLDRGGPEALATFARTEAARFAALELPPIPRDAVRYLAAEMERGEAAQPLDRLIARLRRIVLDRRDDFGS
ncbi:MAG TPA: zf-HC2 domain-containing protein [Thermoanaerobaculia bacterium]|nr:zf-HC2 domain-containing protein [Thermoanaerobaculia bacterium]